MEKKTYCSRETFSEIKSRRFADSFQWLKVLKAATASVRFQPNTSHSAAQFIDKLTNILINSFCSSQTTNQVGRWRQQWHRFLTLQNIRVFWFVSVSRLVDG